MKEWILENNIAEKKELDQIEQKVKNQIKKSKYEAKNDSVNEIIKIQNKSGCNLK